MLFFGRLFATGAVVALATGGGTTVASAAPLAAALATCPSCGHNLVLNPGAEAGPGSNTDSVVKVPDWKPGGGFTAAQYAWGGGDITATTPARKTVARTTSMAAPTPPARRGRK